MLSICILCPTFVIFTSIQNGLSCKGPCGIYLEVTPRLFSYRPVYQAVFQAGASVTAPVKPSVDTPRADCPRRIDRGLHIGPI